MMGPVAESLLFILFHNVPPAFNIIELVISSFVNFHKAMEASLSSVLEPVNVNLWPINF